MHPRREHLSSLNGLGVQWDPGEEVLDCSLPHALTRAAGYLKHVKGHQGSRVFFRGQTEDWKPCVPSLFRAPGRLAQDVQSRRISKLNEYVSEAQAAEAFIKGKKYPYDYAHEALLQHYGVRTPWIDLVDNIWVALWFAVHRCVTRDPKKRATHWHFTASESEYAYVLLVSPGREEPVPTKPGLTETDDGYVIDLRVAAPSLHVRPHAQHGLLFRRETFPPGRDVSIEPHVVGRIRVRTDLARSWLGSGFLHDPHVVFPPPHYDHGYARLLQRAPEVPDELGGIAIVFA